MTPSAALAASTAASGSVVPCAQRRKPDRDRGKGEAEPEGALGRAQDVHGGGRDLRPDAVAFHDDDCERRG
jgi:hypothetical protein